MNEENERENQQPEEEQPSEPKPTAPPPQPQTPRPSPPDEETATISLLYLMDKPEAEVTPPDDPTVTLSGAPESTAPRPPTPLPLTPEELTPPESRPLESDQDATTVQPRVAFPGSELPSADNPLTEAPTQNYERPSVTRPTPNIQDTPTQPHRAFPNRPPLRETQPAPTQRPSAPPPTERQPTHSRPATQPVRVAQPQHDPTAKPQSRSRRNWRGCLTKAFLFLIILSVVGLSLTVAGAAIGYNLIAQDLPPAQELRQNASTFETARIYDRSGNLLYSLADPNMGNRTYITLDQISPLLTQATIATEDARFYENLGFDPIGITRAIVQAAQEREIVSGASTITQQLVRALLLDEEERTQRTFSRKVREIILAAEIARTYEKNEILELYLNEVNYGNRAYGIEAAAQTYFDKPAADLTLDEASLLAGLPQAPALWDPYTAPDKAINRQWQVLSQMIAEEYVTLDEAQAALNETNLYIYDMTPPRSTIKYPHFALTALQQAEDILGAQSIYRGGLRIYTTLDPVAQELANDVITENRNSIEAGGANNAAMVVLAPASGEILAMVGSVDFNSEEISGQVNMALAPRQPGSTIKPFVYLSAMEKGWTPGTLIWDVQTQFPNGANPPYVPKNYDDEFHGPLRLRPSLGNSYNIPAVKALEYYGVCNFITNVQKFGLTSLQDDGCVEQNQPRNYGLSLALGGGEIRPLEMAAAFATLANQGRYNAPHTLTRIENSRGEILYEHTAPPVEETQVVQPEHAYLLSNILSDNDARRPEFGVNNALVIPGHRVAAKTGTSGSTRLDVRDAWTIGYTPHIATAVWVGNTDNDPIGEGASGTRLAAPIWNAFMSRYLADKPQVAFERPPGVVDLEICADSGVAAGPNCDQRRMEIFNDDQPPLPHNSHFQQKVTVDLWTNLRAGDACQEDVYDATFVNLLVTGEENVHDRETNAAQRWIESTGAGQNWANRNNVRLPLRLPPEQTCDADTPRPEASITQPGNMAEIIDTVEIIGTAKGPGFRGYQLDYGLSHNPGGWGIAAERLPNPVENGRLALWDTAVLDANGPVTLRLTIFGPDNPYTPENDPVTMETRVPLILLEPTPTPTATPTNTPTPTATPTFTPTPTITPTPTPTDILDPPTPVLPSLTPTLIIPTIPPRETPYP